MSGGERLLEEVAERRRGEDVRSGMSSSSVGTKLAGRSPWMGS